MKLVVGTDSTWSLRAWIAVQLAQLDVTEQVIDLSLAGYKAKINELSPTGLVPALVDGALSIHDSLAITEYLNECAKGSLFPAKADERALARSLCAELHSGFMTLRSQCPFTLEPVSVLPERSDGLVAELARIQFIFEQAKRPYMFESAGAVDAFYAILAFRLNSYGITFDGKAGEYQQSLLNWQLLTSAIDRAKAWKNG